MRGLDLGVAFSSSLPADNPVKVASDAAAKAFAPGITSPTTLLVEGTKVTSELPRLRDLQARIEAEPGVAGVLGPAQNFTTRAFDVVLAKSGNAARMLIVLKSDPLDATAINDLTAMRDRLPELAASSGLTGARLALRADPEARAVVLARGPSRPRSWGSGGPLRTDRIALIRPTPDTSGPGSATP